MSALEEALVRLARLLQEGGIPYMIIGGIANAMWGEPRSTLDIDVTVWASKDDVARILTLLADLCQVRVSEPLEFVRKTSVLPMEAKDGVRIDLIFGSLPFEREAIERTVEVSIQETPVRFVAPEDLILHKIVSERQKDTDDVRGILVRQRKNLDFAYLDLHIRELSLLLERPEMWNLWQKWKNE